MAFTCEDPRPYVTVGATREPAEKTSVTGVESQPPVACGQPDGESASRTFTLFFLRHPDLAVTVW
jgi:hypothetical protein